jgi:hypothetical protein
MARLSRRLVVVAALALAARVHAAVAPEEAKQLGTTLTEFGAEKAGNADGSIPPYTGGLTQPPASFKPRSGRYRDPFDGEKPLYSVDGKNVAQYAESLSEGQKELLRRYPDFRLDVYPTHRTASFPKYVLDRCAKNAVTAKLTDSGNGVSGDVHACVPFPIPKSGLEVLWNHLLRFNVGDGGHFDHSSTWSVDGAGRRTDAGSFFISAYSWYGEPSKAKLDDAWGSGMVLEFTRPAVQAGEKQLLKYSVDYDKQDTRAWIYAPGQRRVRLAPEFAYDTPIASTGGTQFYDEVTGFAGKPDRFDFKLIGKKEMLVPYNAFKLTFEVPPEKSLTARFPRPDVFRWEKHRVWVVEATLKPGKRHVYQRKVLYFDEDTGAILLADSYDHGGKLQKVGFQPLVPLYDVGGFYTPFVLFDLNKRAYIAVALVSSDGDFVRPRANIDPRALTPDRLVATGVR